MGTQWLKLMNELRQGRGTVEDPPFPGAPRGPSGAETGRGRSGPLWGARTQWAGEAGPSCKGAPRSVRGIAWEEGRG